MGRIAGPFSVPLFPTLRVSPIGLVPKKNGDFRMIHNLSYHATILSIILLITSSVLCGIQALTML
jgi:hypothetical protein